MAEQKSRPRIAPRVRPFVAAATAVSEAKAVPAPEPRPRPPRAVADPSALGPPIPPADPRLAARLDPGFWLREGLLPLRDLGGAVLMAARSPAALARHGPRLERQFGRLLAVPLPAERIEAEVQRLCGAALARRAEQSVAAEQSCRGWGGRQRLPRAALLVALAMVPLAAWPREAFVAAFLWVMAMLVASTLLRLAALTASLRRPRPEPPAPQLVRLPKVSVIICLYDEADIATRLIARLERLDYPRDRLEVLLVVEEGDTLTRAALARSTLPGWMRVLAVPEGRPRTKPRALTYALSHCQGSIIGVYDAEDAPDPDQISRIVTRFAARDRRTACLQGMLDYYNPHSNWLSRCFTVEYASWFRVMLPGIARLGLPVPLGGTTLFFRREVLEELGGWDAHNVTEDADLGLRLARHGYRTELVATTTREEANCRPVAWIRQRSRWNKGYMMTWAVHMRSPRLLWRQLGARGFLGFQVMFLGAMSQAVLAPVLWSFWALSFGLPHPLGGLSGAGFWAVMALFLLAEATALVTGLVGLARSGQRISRLWVPTLHLYHMLGSFAAWKALWEMAVRPFWWDKTRHGLCDGLLPRSVLPRDPPCAQPPLRAVGASRAGVQGGDQGEKARDERPARPDIGPEVAPVQVTAMDGISMGGGSMDCGSPGSAAIPAANVGS